MADEIKKGIMARFGAWLWEILKRWRNNVKNFILAHIKSANETIHRVWGFIHALIAEHIPAEFKKYGLIVVLVLALIIFEIVKNGAVTVLNVLKDVVEIFLKGWQGPAIILIICGTICFLAWVNKPKKA